MADKAYTDSGRQSRCDSLVAARWTMGRAMSAPEAACNSLNLNGFGGLFVRLFKLFRHISCVMHEAASAVAPYFIHIVRANRAHHMIGRCLGGSQVGQQEKQTVAG